MNKQKVLFVLLEVLGINALFRFLHRNKAVILWYHGICDDGFGLLKGYDERHIPKSLFRAQLDYLKRKGYQFATMSEMVRALKDNKRIRKLAVLTFDDGFRNVVEKACPVMKEFDAKGCVYAVTGLIGGNKLLWTDYIETVVRNSGDSEFVFKFKGDNHVYPADSKRSRESAMQDIKDKLRTVSDQERKKYIQQFQSMRMADVPEEFRFSSWEQIKGLDPDVLEVGSHTVNHPNCANLTSDAELEYEIKSSRETIREKTGRQAQHFCYPAGSYNDRVIDHVKRHGYVSAATIIPGFNDTRTDLYQLRRMFVGGDMLQFKANISGSYAFISRIIQWIKGKQ